MTQTAYQKRKERQITHRLTTALEHELADHVSTENYRFVLTHACAQAQQISAEYYRRARAHQDAGIQPHLTRAAQLQFMAACEAQDARDMLMELIDNA